MAYIILRIIRSINKLVQKVIFNFNNGVFIDTKLQCCMCYLLHNNTIALQYSNTKQLIIKYLTNGFLFLILTLTLTYLKILLII
ncbi:hypothetical protein B0A68_22905 [Flavobacterium reichenbachii]|uniref:Uncharacterized protein n=1 Tax=Flavobacterium reichenbachii TaxID=362418 RepID=A0A085ZMN1_9FLAO|nr:hypothetical protein IW19_09270 [Flavobacterium reichenbachii]OXB09996.1 hypothetical protein B0A68_22905 [Flavobacterium reichenbachii]